MYQLKSRNPEKTLAVHIKRCNKYSSTRWYLQNSCIAIQRVLLPLIKVHTTPSKKMKNVCSVLNTPHCLVT